MMRDTGIPHFLAFLVRSNWPAPPIREILPFTSWSGERLLSPAVTSLLLSMLSCRGLGLELQTLSSVTWSRCRLGAQSRNPEEGPGCLKRMQDTEDCRGLWERRAESEDQVSLLSSRHPSLPAEQLLARAGAGRNNGRKREYAGPEVEESKARTPALWASRDH